MHTWKQVLRKFGGASVTAGDNVQGNESILYGLDPETFEQYTISEADPAKGTYYVCPKCRRLLDQRRGEINKDYFAHHPDPWAERNCPWYLGGDESAEPAREEAIEVSQRIRVFIGIGQVEKNLTLFGSIPAFSTADIPVLEEELKLGHGVVTSKGTIRSVNAGRDLLPESASSGITLDPDATQFEIRIVKGFTNSGIWKTRGISSGDVFIGDSTSAERMLDPRFASTGQYIYMVTDVDNHVVNPSTTVYRLGEYRVLRVQVNNSTTEIVHEWVEHINIDSLPLHVDVILPLREDPRKNWLDQTRFKPGEEMTLALTPSARANPKLELVVIPFRNQLIHKLEKIGPGVPRFVRIMNSENTSFRVLVYWPGVPECNVLLDFIPEGPDDNHPLYIEPEIHLSVDQGGKEIVLDPLNYPFHDIEGSLSQQDLPIIPHVKLVSPRHFSVQLRAEFMTREHSIIKRLEGDATGADIQQRLLDAFERAAKKVEVNFGNLGTVTLNCSFFHKKQLDKWDKEDRKESLERERERIAKERRQRQVHLAEMKELVRRTFAEVDDTRSTKISRGYVVEKLALAEDTPKEDLEIFRNLVRRYRKERRRALAKETKWGRQGGKI